MKEEKTMDKSTVSHVPKMKLAAIVALSFSTAFTVLLFAPFDLYLHNPIEFLVGWKFLLPNLLLFTLGGFIVLTTLLMLVCYKKTILGLAALLLCAILVAYVRFVVQLFLSKYMYFFLIIALAALLWILLMKLLKNRTIDFVPLLICGVLIALYMQVLFFNGEMALITGDTANYSALTSWHVINFLLFTAIIFLPLCLWNIFGKTKGIKYEKAMIFIALLISGMQISGMVSTAVSAEIPTGYDENPRYLSYEPSIHFNADDNICVFILDRLDVSFVEEVLEKYPELNDQLDGFTFYKNNVSEYPGTFPSITTMLTQHYYKRGMTVSEYWKEAWSRHTILDILRDNGYAATLLIDKSSTYGDFEEIQDRTNNIREGDIKLNANFVGIVNNISRLSFGRVLPYTLKNFFLKRLSSTFANSLFFLNTNASDIQQLAPGASTDLNYYYYINQNEFTANSEKKVFHLAHMNCSHINYDRTLTKEGYHLDTKTGMIEKSGDYIDTTRACFEILNIYFSKMKKLGVYDNSTVILLGDHGRDFDLKSAVTTGLLIKPKNAKGALQIDTESELSNKYLGASILHIAGLPHLELGLSYYDIIQGAPPPIRRLYNFSVRSFWDNNKSSSCFEISGDANDFSNWKYTEIEN
jgi:hypothetical protein